MASGGDRRHGSSSLLRKPSMMSDALSVVTSDLQSNSKQEEVASPKAEEKKTTFQTVTENYQKGIKERNDKLWTLTGVAREQFLQRFRTST